MNARILLLSSLFPNIVQPHKGQFVRERLDQLRRRSAFGWHVVAPVPWFPFTHDVFGAYGRFARIPLQEVLDEDIVLHPRYAQVPRIGDAISPLAYAHAVARCVRRHALEFDVIDAHFLFPDGVAATLLGREFRKPVVMTARGSDINLMLDEPAAGRWIRWAVRNCDRLVAVSRPMAERLARLSRGRNVLLAPNGVDTCRFRPIADREELRSSLQLSGPTVLSAGNLIELKGHHLVIEAIVDLPEVQLLVAGDGPWRHRLEDIARRLGLASRVRFVGAVSQRELIQYYNAADLLVLASSSEGSPNVVLEALACGTRVISTVEAAPEGPAGRDVVVIARNTAALQRAIARELQSEVPRTAVHERAASLGWDRTSQALLAMFSDLTRDLAVAA